MKDVNLKKSAELELMLAFKVYIDSLVVDAVKRHGMTAVPTEGSIRRTPTRWIYFIQGEAGGAIKIGVANDPAKRLAEIQRTSPVKLQIVSQRPGDTIDEKRLHLQFADYRLHGEWFEPCDELLAEIAGEEVDEVAS